MSPSDRKSPRSASSNGIVTYSYAKDWTPDYLAAAEFELVVQKQHLPVHKHVMSMSPVFQKELFRTESKRAMLSATLKKGNQHVTNRMQLTSPMFLDVSVEDICLLLSHVYATEATLSSERMEEVRKLFGLTEEFGFPSITRRCVNFVRNVENLTRGVRTDLEMHDAIAASEWLELAVKWDFDAIKDEVCDYAGENFLEIYGRENQHEPDQKWADLIMVLESDMDLWKRLARKQAIHIESGPSLASLISDEPSTTLIYGVLIGIFAGSILPSWMFFLILAGTMWYIANRMPPGLLLVIQKTLEGAMQGILHGEGTQTDASAEVQVKDHGTKRTKSRGKPPVIHKHSHVTA